MSENNYTIWGLIKYILGFIFNRFRKKSTKSPDEFQESKKKLEQTYEELDKENEEKKDEDLEKRLNNMF